MTTDIQPKKNRRNSGALMEERAPDWIENSSLLRTIHEFIYPSGTKWYWYRRGSGYFFPLLLLIYSACLRYVYELGDRNVSNLFEGLNVTELAISTNRPDWYPLAQTKWFIFAQCFASGFFTCLVYTLSGLHLIQKFYIERKNETEKWKCQPNGFLTPERWREEKILGSFNAFIAGFFGTGLYFVHLNYPFLKFYYETGQRGMFHFFASALFVYIWIDFYSYWAHRFLHTKYMYKNVHKVHHRYVHPTPFSAFALHPIEFLVFQSAGIIQAAFVPIHIIGYLFVVLFIAYHNQLDHSGIDFEGDLPWMPTSKYHDDHHLYFHLNFGLHLVFWDWLGGTLRSKQRLYGEDLFVGEQETLKKEQ